MPATESMTGQWKRLNKRNFSAVSAGHEKGPDPVGVSEIGIQAVGMRIAYRFFTPRISPTYWPKTRTLFRQNTVNPGRTAQSQSMAYLPDSARPARPYSEHGCRSWLWTHPCVPAGRTRGRYLPHQELHGPQVGQHHSDLSASPAGSPHEHSKPPGPVGCRWKGGGCP